MLLGQIRMDCASMFLGKLPFVGNDRWRRGFTNPHRAVTSADNAPVGLANPTVSSKVRNPFRRVLRGGSWNNNTNNLRCANRNNNNPTNTNNNNGFRCAQYILGCQNLQPNAGVGVPVSFAGYHIKRAFGMSRVSFLRCGQLQQKTRWQRALQPNIKTPSDG